MIHVPEAHCYRTLSFLRLFLLRSRLKRRSTSMSQRSLVINSWRALLKLPLFTSLLG